jgi:hypothetical protein
MRLFHLLNPSLFRGGTVDSRAVFLRAKFFFETRPGTVHVLCEHFRGSTNQHAIPNRRTSAKEKEILLVVHDDLANYNLLVGFPYICLTRLQEGL